MSLSVPRFSTLRAQPERDMNLRVVGFDAPECWRNVFDPVPKTVVMMALACQATDGLA